MPTLVLVGEHDIPDVHSHAGAIEAGIPHARPDVIAESGHVPYLERPWEFVTLALGFLQGATFQAVLDNEGPARAMEVLRAARAKNPSAILFAEDDVNRRAYRRQVEGALPDAIALCRVNTESYPASANAWDSLGEILLAAGDRDGATAAHRRSLTIEPAAESAREALKKLESGRDATAAPLGGDEPELEARSGFARLRPIPSSDSESTS